MVSQILLTSLSVLLEDKNVSLSAKRFAGPNNTEENALWRKQRVKLELLANKQTNKNLKIAIFSFGVVQ